MTLIERWKISSPSSKSEPERCARYDHWELPSLCCLGGLARITLWVWRVPRCK